MTRITNLSELCSERICHVMNYIMEIAEASAIEGLPISNAISRHGMRFRLVRTLNKKANVVKERWGEQTKFSKKTKDKEELIWNIIPLGFTLNGRKLSYADAEYTYLITFNYRSTDSSCNSLQMEKLLVVDGYGRLRKTVASSNDIEHRDFLPRSLLKEINCVLYEKFYDSLSVGEGIGCWRLSRNQEILHMGYRDNRLFTPQQERAIEAGRLSDSYRRKLHALVNSPVGGYGTVLLAYTAFSILHPFFRKYKTLPKSADSTKIPKKLSEQISLVLVQNNCSDAALNTLLRFCCGSQGMNHMTLAGIHRMPETMNANPLFRLSRKSYETALSEFNCPLWVCLNLEATSKIADISPLVLQLFEFKEIYPTLGNGDELFALFTTQLELRGHSRIESHQEALKIKCRERLQELYDTLNNAREYTPPLKDIPDYLLGNRVLTYPTINDWELDAPPTYNLELSLIMKYLQYIRKQCMWDIDEKLEDDQKSAFDDIELDCLEEIWEGKAKYISELLSSAKKDILNYYKQVGHKELYFDDHFQRSLTQIKDEGNINPCYFKRAAYLHASFKILCEHCELPPKLNDILLDVLNRMLAFNRNPQDELERYLLQSIEDNACARIRGVGSDKSTINLWYDPIRKQFLLPYQDYWKECSTCVYPGIQKKAWEESLDDILVSVKRGKQNRRTSSACVRIHGSAINVLRVDTRELSQTFMERAIVRETIQSCIDDHTPYRTPTKSTTVLSPE